MKRIKNIKPRTKKITAIATAAVLTATAILCGVTIPSSQVSAAEDTLTDDESVLADTAKELLKTTTKSSENGKEETVYVIGDADGNQSDIIVSSWLKNGDGVDELTDKTDLTDIENTKGDEDYTENSDGTITWDAHGDDIYYRGHSTDELPLSVGISYTLDGKSVSAQELQGASGHLKITFSYENKVSKTALVNGKEVTLNKPCAVVSGLLLDGEKSANVTVSNGKVVNDGDRSIVVGLALPGMKENLDLSSLDAETTDKVDSLLPENVTIEADVTDFSMSGTISLASYDIPLNLNLDSYQDKLNDLRDSADKLQDGANQLVDGAASLKNYLEEFKTGTETLANGTGQLADGASSLSSGASTLASGSDAVNSGAASLQSGASQLSDGLNQLSSSVASLPDGAGKLYEGAQKLSAALKSGDDSSVDTYGVYEAVVAIGQGADTLSGVLQGIMNGASALYDGAMQISAGAKSGSEDPSSYGIYEAASALQSQLNEVVSGLSTSLQQAVGGINAAEGYGNAAKAAVNQLIAEGVLTSEQAQGILGNIGGEETTLEAVKGALTSTGIDTTKINTVITGIQNGAEGIVAGASRIAQGARSGSEDPASYGVYEAAAAALAGTTQLSASASELAAKIDYMAGSENMGALVDGLASLNSQSAQLISAVGKLSGGASALSSGASTLAGGTASLNNGAQTLANGASTLSSGAASADSGAKKLANASGQLVDGARTLADGINTLNEDGIAKITELVGDKAEGFYDRLQAIIDYAQEQQSFSGVSDGTDCSVSYIYKTGEISDSSND